MPFTIAPPENAHDFCKVNLRLHAAKIGAANDKRKKLLSLTIYYIMGRFYYDAHPDQAFLCLQNALFYCYVPEDIEMIHAEIKSLMMLHEVTVRNVAIIVPSYNSCYLIQKNIESIRRTLLEGTYSIIVVDNASDDGTRQ